MNMNRKMKNRLAQSTAIALTAVMMTTNAIGTQASSTDLTNTENTVTTISVADTTAGYTSVLAASQPDDVTVTLNLQGDAIFSGMESAVNRVAEEKAAQEAAEAEAAAAAAAAAEAEAQAQAAAAAAAQAQTAAVENSQSESYSEDTTESVQTTEYSETVGESVSASTDDLTLLAALIQCEAGGECYEGQVAVGAVVLNRLYSGYSSDIYGVIYQRGQFGPAMTGKLDRVLASGNISSSCYAAASDAFAGVDYTGGARNFQVSSTGIAGTVIGNHVFF